jgi:hypothetical protein
MRVYHTKYPVFGGMTGEPLPRWPQDDELVAEIDQGGLSPLKGPTGGSIKEEASPPKSDPPEESHAIAIRPLPCSASITALAALLSAISNRP